MPNHIRSGARGGHDQFSWDAVKEDKYRQNYLGSSIHGVPDRFKKGPETFWYAKSSESSKESSVDEEIRAVKAKEAALMSHVLAHGTGAVLPPVVSSIVKETKPERVIELTKRVVHETKDRTKRNRSRSRELRIRDSKTRDRRDKSVSRDRQRSHRERRRSRSRSISRDRHRRSDRSNRIYSRSPRRDHRRR